jgi:hypothetical protein
MQVSLNSAQHEKRQAPRSIALKSADQTDQSLLFHSSNLDHEVDVLNSAAEANELLLSFGIPPQAFEEQSSIQQRVTMRHDSNARIDTVGSSCRHVAFTELAQRVRAQSAKQQALLVSHENSQQQQQQQQEQSQLCDELVPAKCAQALLQQIAANSSCKLSQQQQHQQRSQWPLHGPLFCASHRLSHASGCSSGRCMLPLSRRCLVPSELVGR